MQGSDDTLIISGARWKSVARFLGCFAIIAFSLWLSFGDMQFSRYDQAYVKIVGGLCCLIFSWNALHNFWQAIRPPRLLLTHEGFQVQGIRNPIIVRWGEVEAFDVAEIAKSQIAAFTLRPGSTAIRDQRLTRAVTPGFDGLIAVFPSFGPDQLVDILSDWRRRYGQVAQSDR